MCWGIKNQHHLSPQGVWRGEESSSCPHPVGSWDSPVPQWGPLEAEPARISLCSHKAQMCSSFLTCRPFLLTSQLARICFSTPLFQAYNRLHSPFQTFNHLPRQRVSYIQRTPGWEGTIWCQHLYITDRDTEVQRGQWLVAALGLELRVTESSQLLGQRSSHSASLALGFQPALLPHCPREGRSH